MYSGCSALSIYKVQMAFKSVKGLSKGCQLLQCSQEATQQATLPRPSKGRAPSTFGKESHVYTVGTRDIHACLRVTTPCTPLHQQTKLKAVRALACASNNPSILSWVRCLPSGFLHVHFSSRSRHQHTLHASSSFCTLLIDDKPVLLPPQKNPYSVLAESSVTQNVCSPTERRARRTEQRA